MKFKTIKELHKAVKSGKIDESNLLIMLDNDATYFRFKESDEDIEVKETNGYQDIEKLYPLLFPKATVEWV
jgi:hypothetical protein